MPRRLPALLLTAAALAALPGCGGSAGAVSQAQAPRTAAHPSAPSAASGPSAAAAAAAEQLPQRLPGLGPQTLAEIPANARQAVVVTGRSENSPVSQAVLYQRTADGWEAGETWAAHNAKNGWTDDHHAGDLHSPIGVFSLSDAGGRLPDPGTRLPYDQSRSGFHIGGTGFEGESLAGSFDYVIAIDYNRRTGVSPLDWTRPEGESKGGGIWFHVDHGGPTHGCVSLSAAHMRTLLRTLDPSQHPVVVMGDGASLAR